MLLVDCHVINVEYLVSCLLLYIDIHTYYPKNFAFCLSVKWNVSSKARNVSHYL